MKRTTLLVLLSLFFLAQEGCDTEDLDQDGWTLEAGDCNDREAAVHPEAEEVCDGVDQDCDGQVDEGVMSSWYVDGDGDGYGTGETVLEGCVQPEGYASLAGDCSDELLEVNPGAEESCNGVDDNCDGQLDEGVLLTWYPDSDSDGYGLETGTVDACTQPEGYASLAGDCSDELLEVNPGAKEICNSMDDNCDGQIDEGVLFTWYPDSDSDGYGAEEEDVFLEQCVGPDGYVPARGDCADDVPTSYPGAEDFAGDGIDADCGGTDAADPHVGLTETSYPTIQAALDAAADGQVVWVGPGTYLEHELTMSGKAIALRSTRGEDLTVVDGQGAGTVVLFVDGEGADSVLDGFNIAEGVASYDCLSGGYCGYYGGGGVPILLIPEPDPDHTEREHRGLRRGMVLYSSSPSLTQITLSGNSASDGGGGMVLYSSSPSLTHVTLSGNTASDKGGGMYLYVWWAP